MHPRPPGPKATPSHLRREHDSAARCSPGRACRPLSRLHEAGQALSRRRGRHLHHLRDSSLLSVRLLVTVDPHLHRYKSLDEIYSIPTRVVHSAPFLAEWIAANEPAPLLIGPDIESEQWVSEVAARANAPYRILRKQRHGDRDVEITIPDLHEFSGRMPVLVDDIISSGRTIIETA